jgi:hypothetical protein
MLRNRGRGLNYARRQQYRRLSRAGRLGLAGRMAGLFGMLLLAIDFALPALPAPGRRGHRRSARSALTLPRRAEQGRRSL